MDVYQRRRLVALSVLAVIFILFVLLIRSCGGDDEAPVTPVSGATGTGGATALSQADYIDQGDEICLQANTAMAAVDTSDPQGAASDQADIVSGELQQLQSLPAPDDGETKLGNFLNALEQQATAYGDKATALERGDDAAASDLDATIEEAQNEAAHAAKRFGFKACGDPSKVGESDTSGGGDSTTDSTDTSSGTDTGGTVTPSTTVEPAPTTPAEPAPTAPTDGGGATPTPTPAAPSDGGTDGTSSGGVSP